MAGYIYDFHSHILPGMDDGCKTPQEALQALIMSYAQGVRFLFATPHFYADESIEEFLARRKTAAALLAEAVQEYDGPLPEICLGAEVAYYPDISRTEGLKELCLGNSEYLLLEMPFCKWGGDVLRDLQMLCSGGEVTPILAHIDRYWNLQSKETFRRIFPMELGMQINGASLLDWKRRRKAKKWLSEGLVQHIGSDCHNLSSRAPNLGPALSVLREDAFFFELSSCGARVWEKATEK